MKIYFAPMEGVVDHHMRYLQSKIGGIDLCVTEFIRVTDHTLPRHVFLRSCPELTPVTDRSSEMVERYGAKVPTRVQLLGSNVEAIALNGLKAAKLGAPAIDINFGCPAKTVNRNYGGARLLNETPLVAQIVRRTRELVPPSTPVTAKIRLGYDDRSSYLDNAKAIADAGANELIVHARSKQDGYNPPAYWHYIQEIKNAISIPVIANGEIWSVDDYKRCQTQSGCDDVMLGRGLLARPDLGLAIKAYQQGRPYQYASWSDIAVYVREFLHLTAKHYAAKHTGNRVKQWLFYLKRNYYEAEDLFEQIKRSKDFDFIDQAISKYI